ncbi:hypothetical protein [Pedobacter sp.]|uniref:hypothetical protein n=1 Tax=Pedobacter sp. TaxID=1411316 RepID=UPI0031D840A6
MKCYTEIQIGRQSAIWSFSIGTFLFLAYCITNSSIFLVIGLCYLLLAILYNTTILLIVIVSAFSKKGMFVEHLKAIGLMLLNIPVVLIYLHLMGLFNF